MEQTLAEAPVLMLPSERLLLYAFVQAFRPQSCLEIGTHKGGSALIIAAALDQVGTGRLICIDPAPLVSEQHWERIAHRATLLTGASPAILTEASRLSGPFDFALIDGDHSYEGVLRDINGVMPVLADHAYMLFHDAHFPEVSSAIDAILRAHSTSLTDCGLLSIDQSVDEDGRVWGGLRLVRFARSQGQYSSVHSTTHPDYAEQLRLIWQEPDDRRFVAEVFRIVLGRSIDPAGSDAFAAALASGASRFDVVHEIATSQEATAKHLPTSWLAALVLDANFTRQLPTPFLKRVLRSARRAIRLPWIVEQIQLLSRTQHQRLAVQQDQLTQLQLQLEAVSSELRTILKQRKP